MKESDPKYTEINYLQTLLCITVNQHMHGGDLTFDEQKEVIRKLKSVLGNRLRYIPPELKELIDRAMLG